MAYFAPYIDASGIHLPTYADRLSDLYAAYRSIFGQEAELSPAVSAQISAYIREIPGVLEVGNVQFSGFLLGAEYPDCLTGKDRCSFTAITVNV